MPFDSFVSSAAALVRDNSERRSGVNDSRVPMTSRLSVRVAVLGVLAGAISSDVNIAATALVDASRGVGMGPELIPVAASAASMFCAASVASAGLVGDRLGRRRVLMGGLVLGICAGLIVVLSDSPWTYVGGRSLMGVSGGAVFSAAFAFVRVVSTPATLGRALGGFGAVAGVTVIVGSFLGGALATTAWRGAYLVVPGIFLVCLVLVPLVLPRQSPVSAGPWDVGGQVLLAVGVIGVLVSLSSATTDSGLIPLTALLAGGGALIGFVIRESRTAHPFFPMTVLRSPTFLAGVVFGVGFNISAAVMILQPANLWQYGRGMDTVAVAAAQLPGLAIGVVASIVAGRLLSAGWHERRLGSVGFAAVVVGFGSLALVRTETPIWLFIPALMLIGAGAQTLNVPFGALTIASAPAGALGPVTASRATIGSFASSFGIAASTIAIDRLTSGGYTARLAQAGVPPQDYGRAVDVVSAYVRSDVLSTTRAAQAALQQAIASYTEAFAITMGATALLMGALAVLGSWMLRTVRPQAGGRAGGAQDWR